MRVLKIAAAAFVAVYLLPVLVAAGLWYLKDRPANWRQANWASSGLLPAPSEAPDAAIYVFSAATGGLKGAIASHAWIVTKARGADSYMRYDKVGWGNPVRRNAYAPDAYWYSNTPAAVVSLTGEEAERLIPRIEAAIASYPYASPGGYRMWPGPNSNTFVAHVLRNVPELGAVLPPDAVGRDYLPDGKWFSVDADGKDLHLTLYGLAGISAGVRSGLELNIAGLVAGLDFVHPAIKIPALGRIGIRDNAFAADRFR